MPSKAAHNLKARSKIPGVINNDFPSIRKHAGTGAASDQPAIPEPSYFEQVDARNADGLLLEDVGRIAHIDV
jgi:hypothetical protein